MAKAPRTPDHDRIDAYLASASHDDLARLLGTVARAVPEAGLLIEAEAADADGDPKAIEKVLKDAVSTATSGWRAVHSRSSDVACAVEVPVAMLEATLDQHPGAVAAASRKLLERLRTLFLRIDDSSGILQEVTHRVIDLDRRAAGVAIAADELDAAVYGRWIVKFNQSDSAGAPEVFLDADHVEVLGEKGLRALGKALDAWERKVETGLEGAEGVDASVTPIFPNEFSFRRRRPFELDHLQQQLGAATGDGGQTAAP